MLSCKVTVKNLPVHRFPPHPRMDQQERQRALDQIAVLQAQVGPGGRGKRKRRSGHGAEPAALAIDGAVPAKVMRLRESINDWKQSNDSFEDNTRAGIGLLLEAVADIMHKVENMEKKTKSLSTASAQVLLQDNVREHCYRMFYGKIGAAMESGSNLLVATDQFRVPTAVRNKEFTAHWQGIQQLMHRMHSFVVLPETCVRSDTIGCHIRSCYIHRYHAGSHHGRW